ncbi:MAG TPA: hypothetical protein PLV25_03275, partial [Opitutales bacterium]|nr:hypothetical protein [Opitutales bacterium]
LLRALIFIRGREEVEGLLNVLNTENNRQTPMQVAIRHNHVRFILDLLQERIGRDALRNSGYCFLRALVQTAEGREHFAPAINLLRDNYTPADYQHFYLQRDTAHDNLPIEHALFRLAYLRQRAGLLSDTRAYPGRMPSFASLDNLDADEQARIAQQLQEVIIPTFIQEGGAALAQGEQRGVFPIDIAAALRLDEMITLLRQPTLTALEARVVETQRALRVAINHRDQKQQENQICTAIVLSSGNPVLLNALCNLQESNPLASYDNHIDYLSRLRDYLTGQINRISLLGRNLDLDPNEVPDEGDFMGTGLWY